VDYHVKGLQLLGATMDLEGGVYRAEAAELRGAEIYLDFPSAGATQHLMATACLATGCTVIENAAMEPEVTALADLLVRMGARVEGAGTSRITITGVEELSACDFRIPEDSMQAGTFLLAGAITKGDVTVEGVMPEYQTALLNKLREAGIDCTEGPDWVRCKTDSRPKAIKIRTMPYPGFPTDIQQPVAALLALAEGTSVIEETIYESRIGHVAELNRMGAKMTVTGGRSVTIEGVETLTAAYVESSDLRAGAALILAALAAEGESVISNVHFVDRGYEDIEGILSTLGAQIRRVTLAETERSAT
jgi:UDP-N-acetylglucosamine 1-carboxyvinyltransferase